MKRGGFTVEGVSLLLLLDGSSMRARFISVEQFSPLSESAGWPESSAGSQNGFRAAEKVRVCAWLALIACAFGGYVIPCFYSLSPTVIASSSSRVSHRVPRKPVQTSVRPVCGCFFIEGGRGSEFVGNTGFVDWISPREKFSHWTGGAHGHGC